MAGYITYYRVSTERQGQSGLGLDAQRVAVNAYIGASTVVAEVIEIESGKRNDRPKLDEALRLCRAHGATLVIAKLDRLARNVAFVSALMEGGVNFVACDMPQANRLTIHILAAVAEHEAKMISERTKAALQAAKARGKLLGGFRGHHIPADAARASLDARRASARAHAADVMPIIASIRASGVTSFGAIARALTDRRVITSHGGTKWEPTQVKRLIEANG
jgi:DNA invertase Pin-like site-specific DNA recombinase